MIGQLNEGSLLVMNISNFISLKFLNFGRLSDVSPACQRRTFKICKLRFFCLGILGATPTWFLGDQNTDLSNAFPHLFVKFLSEIIENESI